MNPPQPPTSVFSLSCREPLVVRTPNVPGPYDVVTDSSKSDAVRPTQSPAQPTATPFPSRLLALLPARPSAALPTNSCSTRNAGYPPTPSQPSPADVHTTRRWSTPPARQTEHYLHLAYNIKKIFILVFVKRLSTRFSVVVGKLKANALYGK